MICHRRLLLLLRISGAYRLQFFCIIRSSLLCDLLLRLSGKIVYIAGAARGTGHTVLDCHVAQDARSEKNVFNSALQNKCCLSGGHSIVRLGSPVQAYLALCRWREVMHISRKIFHVFFTLCARCRCTD